jgi:hypothetical protein
MSLTRSLRYDATTQETYEMSQMRQVADEDCG